jgi:hypothetical protein
MILLIGSSTFGEANGFFFGAAGINMAVSINHQGQFQIFVGHEL